MDFTEVELFWDRQRGDKSRKIKRSSKTWEVRDQVCGQETNYSSMVKVDFPFILLEYLMLWYSTDLSVRAAVQLALSYNSKEGSVPTNQWSNNQVRQQRRGEGRRESLVQLQDHWVLSYSLYLQQTNNAKSDCCYTIAHLRERLKVLSGEPPVVKNWTVWWMSGCLCTAWAVVGLTLGQHEGYTWRWTIKTPQWV